jgi:hypothetical protein
VKHFKDSQQTDYSTDHGNTYVDRERERKKLLKCVFFCKEKPCARSCPDLPLGDTAAVAPVDRDMLTRVWNEIDNRIDVCRITKCGHIQHLESFSLHQNYHNPLSSVLVNFLNVSQTYE